MKNEELINQVVAQIVKDINNGDLTAIEELIKNISDENLKAFLSDLKE